MFLLVLIIEGAFQGEADQVVAFIERSEAPVWVLQSGVANMHMASSALDEDVAARLRQMPEVGYVEGILYGGSLAHIGQDERALYFIGVRPGQRTRPWDMAAGKASPGPGEVVLPDVLARRGGVDLGGTIEIHKRLFKVVGLSRGTYSMANSLAFLHASDLASLLDIIADASDILVWPRPGVAPSQLAASIRAAIPTVSVLERETLVANDRTLALKMGGELIRIMTVVAALVAALIVGFTVYMFAARHTRELAVAKAVGARGGQLLGAAVAQAIGLVLLGYGLALGLAAVLQPIFTAYSPGIIIHFSAASFARVGVAALAVALVAGVLPAWRVLRVDPTLVFSS
jgi:putative ABC transport system permease protein